MVPQEDHALPASVLTIIVGKSRTKGLGGSLCARCKREDDPVLKIPLKGERRVPCTRGDARCRCRRYPEAIRFGTRRGITRRGRSRPRAPELKASILMQTQPSGRTQILSLKFAAEPKPKPQAKNERIPQQGARPPFPSRKILPNFLRPAQSLQRDLRRDSIPLPPILQHALDNPDKPKPVAIGSRTIWKSWAAEQGYFPEETKRLLECLNALTSSATYTRQVSKARSQRHSIKGEHIEPVSDEHCAQARELNATRAAGKRKRAGGSKRGPKT